MNSTELSKEERWAVARSKQITSSKLGLFLIQTAKKYFGDGAIAYLKEVKMEIQEDRPISGSSFAAGDWGNMQEAYAAEWVRQNLGHVLKHADEDFEEKLFKKTEYGFGDSIDGLIYDEFDQSKIIKSWENKSPTTKSAEWCFVFSNETTDEMLKEHTIKKHGGQIMGHLMAYDVPVVFTYYKGQDENDKFDKKDPMDKSRGRVLEFTEDDFEKFDFLKTRVKQAFDYLHSGKPISEINEYFKIK